MSKALDLECHCRNHILKTRNQSEKQAYGGQDAQDFRNSFHCGGISSVKAPSHPSELFGSGARVNSPSCGFGHPFGGSTNKEATSGQSSASQSSCTDHPWAHLVKPRRLPLEELTDKQVDSTLSLDIYKHVPSDGYFSDKFARTLFPQLSSCYVMSHPLPFVELQTLNDAVNFRKHSQKLIDDLLRRVYIPEKSPKEKTPEGTMPSVLSPPTVDGRRPVLYQVVYVSRNEQMLVLEAKDLFVMLPDRLDLHCIVLNEQSVNVQSKKLGFDPRLASIKDFVWVWTVEPTDKALDDPETILKMSRWPRLTAFDSRSTYFFRAALFTFVRPAVLCEKVYGSVLSIQGTWSPVEQKYDPVNSFKAAFEGAAEAIKLNQSICDFKLSSVQRGEILLAESRRDVSCAVRFSEPAASPEAERQLCKFIKNFLPSHPDEGIMPFMVRKLSPEDSEWFNDRLEKFHNYKMDPVNARKKMSKVFNMACSSLEACRSLDYDKRIHRVTADVPDISASLVRLKVVLRRMPRELGWAPGKPAVVWVEGSKTISRVLVEKVSNNPEMKTLDVTLVARRWSHDLLVRLVEAAAERRTGKQCHVDVWINLGKLPTSASPLYETLVQMRLFDNLHVGSLGNTILDSVYGRRPVSPIVKKPHVSREQLRNLVPTVGGKKITLTGEQRKAVLQGCAGYPVVAIPANFGSGKTLVAAVIAALSSKKKVILTGNTNEIVANIANTLCSIEEFKEITVLRYVSLGTTWKERHSTPVDMDAVLKNLGENFSADIKSTADRSTCGRFRERLSASLTAQEREELELVETNVSPFLKDMIRIMFNVRSPDIICITTSSLLNAFGFDGIFAQQSQNFSLVICDEAGQVPEPMFVAITNRLPHVRQVYIGDQRQFSPHTRCNNSWTITQLGARNTMDVLLGVSPNPDPVMRKSFTAHPILNELPRLIAYGEHLVDGADATDRRLALDLLSFPNSSIPFLFVDVVMSKSTITESLSSFNTLEASVCKKILAQLLAKGLNSTEITIVNFYKEQQRRLAGIERDLAVENTTVEAFQNRHNEIVILLTTKAEPEPSPSKAYSPNHEDVSEFLEESDRLVTALTRARQGLIILGSRYYLNFGDNWGKIIRWAERSGGVMKSIELHRFYEAPIKMRKEKDEAEPASARFQRLLPF